LPVQKALFCYFFINTQLLKRGLITVNLPQKARKSKNKKYNTLHYKENALNVNNTAVTEAKTF